MQLEDIVKLNVRGKFILTSTKTFEKYQESPFKHYIKNQNENGVYYIDQDQLLFDKILDYLRFGRLRKTSHSLLVENSLILRPNFAKL